MARLAADAAYLTPGQAARLLGVSPKTVNRWANDGRIPCAMTLGGHRRFRAEVIQAVATSMGLGPSIGVDGSADPEREPSVEEEPV